MADERAFHLAAGKRILWGAAFSLAILKTIKVIGLPFIHTRIMISKGMVSKGQYSKFGTVKGFQYSF